MGIDKKRILVVDDNQVLRDVISFNLKRAGFAVSACVNGRQATELLDRERFDLIITDYQMPEMNGEELSRYARQNARHAEVPIFWVSAKGFELELTRLTEELSLTKVFFKPFSPKDLVESARAALEPVLT